MEAAGAEAAPGDASRIGSCEARLRSGTIRAVSEAVVDREEIELMIWAIADIRTDVREIHELIFGGDDEEEAEEDQR